MKKMGRPRGTKKQLAQQRRLTTGAGKMIGYCRVSTSGQAEHGHSLDWQASRLQEVCEREGFDLVRVITEAESGTKDRDGLAEAQAAVLAGEAQGIIAPKLDRLGRSTIAMLRFQAWCVDNGVDLLTTEEGWLVRDGVALDEMFTVRAWFGEQEAKKISERTKAGLSAARSKGIRLGAVARREEDDPVVLRAVALREQGMGLQAIADLFNAEGLTTATGKAFRANAVWRYIERAKPAANVADRGNYLVAVG